MAWVKLDDQAPRHRKMLKAGPAACWLWVCGLAHCQSQLTDGFIAIEALSMIGVKGAARSLRLAEELVKVGLFEHAEGGYHVHDYLAFNRSRDEAVARQADLSAVRARSGRSGGLKSGEARKQNTKQTAEAKRSPDPTRPLEEPPNPLFQRGRATKRELRDAEKIRAKRFGRCTHETTCASTADCLERIALECRERAS